MEEGGEEEEEDEEDEPILKFSRMADLHDLKVILQNDSISCLAVHSRVRAHMCVMFERVFCHPHFPLMRGDD